MPKQKKDKPNALPTSGPVWGAKAIGAVINKTPRETFHLLEKGLIPANQVGRQWVSTVEALLAAVTPA